MSCSPWGNHMEESLFWVIFLLDFLSTAGQVSLTNSNSPGCDEEELPQGKQAACAGRWLKVPAGQA